MRTALVVTAHPNVRAAIPTVEAGDPHELCARRGGDDFDTNRRRRRRRGLDDELDLRRRRRNDRDLRRRWCGDLHLRGRDGAGGNYLGVNFGRGRRRRVNFDFWRHDAHAAATSSHANSKQNDGRVSNHAAQNSRDAAVKQPSFNRLFRGPLRRAGFGSAAAANRRESSRRAKCKRTHIPRLGRQSSIARYPL